MRADWPEAARSKLLRQWGTLERIAEFVEATPQFSGLILLGSLAKGEGDTVSDIDLLIAAPNTGFADAWDRRNGLHITAHLPSGRDNSQIFQKPRPTSGSRKI